PAEHYYRFGALLRRNPSRDFNAEFYLQKHADVARAGVNPLLHYISSGHKEGRKISVVQESEQAYQPGAARMEQPAPVRLARAALREWPQPPTRQPLISMIILNRNGAPMLDAALRSFLAHNTYPNCELIVVDHASVDGSIDLLRRWEKLLPLRTIACDQNFSFSYSNNRAVESANGEYLLLMNNDVVFASDMLGRMAAVLGSEQVGAVGVKQIQGNPASYDPGFVYHTGIRFDWNVDGRFLQPRNQNGSSPVDGLLSENPASFPAITASLLLCRRADYVAVGGLHEGYSYGYEDVDLCCKFRYSLGKELVSLNSDFAYHNESSSRKLVSREETRTQRLNNRTLLLKRFGYQIRREFVERMLLDDGSYLGRPITVGIAVTTLDKDSGAGDLYTALGLGGALKRTFGWEVRYLPKHEWTKAQDLDVYISMRDDVDVGTLEDARPHLIRVAWIRNWVERWSTAPWLQRFDLYLSSSTLGKNYLKEVAGVDAEVFPIAADTTIFNKGTALPGLECDYVFTGNHWQSPVPREIESFDPSGVPYDFHLYGKSWNAHPRFSPYARGFIDFNSLPGIYSSAKITIDDTVTHVTKRWASVNSRVFEALACGSLVLTNNHGGAEELFEGVLPVWNSAGDLTNLLTHYLGNSEERVQLVGRLRNIVLSKHTYDVRATNLRQMLADSVRRLRVAIKCPVPRMSEAQA
ncbi:MAG TPA: glycosyltransferase, partial [Pseudoxanthomonas sp.]|nr:glycosyltransferase [Pseudoxanthomonas sp.]